jgi:hypothetical protein
MNTVIKDLEGTLKIQVKLYKEEKEKFRFDFNSFQKKDHQHSLEYWENRINQTSKAIIILKKHITNDNRNQTVRINQD